MFNNQHKERPFFFFNFYYVVVVAVVSLSYFFIQGIFGVYVGYIELHVFYTIDSNYGVYYYTFFLFLYITLLTAAG